MNNIIKSVAFFIISANTAICCDCDIKDYDSYDYIALVEIECLSFENQEHNYEISYKTITQFKGNESSHCIVNSGHPSFKSMSSCNITFKENQQWILCAYSKHSKIHTSYCTKSQLYRKRNGEIRKRFSLLDNEISKLLQQYKPTKSQSDTGPPIGYYENGRIEYEETSVNGKLEGERFVYYKTGQVMSYQCFHEGIKQEEEIIYNSNGTLSKRCSIVNGQYQTCHYYKNGELNFKILFDERGKFLRRENANN